MSAPREPRLSGMTAVVTGASSGIGRAIALAMAREGAALVLQARANKAGLAETAERAAALGAEVTQVLHDFASVEGCERCVDEAWRWRPFDIWVHNAGADVLTGEAAGLAFADKLDLLYRTDLRGAMLTCRDAGRRMQQRGAGAVVTIGWDQAAVGMAGDSGELFAAIKGAVMAFTLSLARSLAPQVRVNCVAPGWVRTKWGESAPENWQRRAEREAMLGRWGHAEDVAEAVVFLASPQAGFVTGQVLNVNGGFAGSAES